MNGFASLLLKKTTVPQRHADTKAPKFACSEIVTNLFEAEAGAGICVRLHQSLNRPLLFYPALIGKAN